MTSASAKVGAYPPPVQVFTGPRQRELCSNLVYQPGLMELGRRRTVADHVVVKAQSSNEEVRHARRYVQTDHPRK
jgi:hypothetical protein